MIAGEGLQLAVDLPTSLWRPLEIHVGALQRCLELRQALSVVELARHEHQIVDVEHLPKEDSGVFPFVMRPPVLGALMHAQLAVGLHQPEMTSGLARIGDERKHDALADIDVPFLATSG